MTKLNGKIAVITGGTSGIGLSAASLFRREGARVVIVGSNRERLEAARTAAGLSDDDLAVLADLRNPADIDRLIGQVHDRYGHIDILYANAGLGLAAPLEAVTEAQIDEQLGVNFKGLFFTVQKAVPLMGKGGISTPFASKIGLNEQELKAMAADVEARVPLQRFGEAEEVARAALFLAGPDGSYITGTELVVDGGLSQL
jgi:NAD(P)-dependent dehydrogenase (short-subunit alcohol dehydrogenase family)